jgi:hypothetical protein
MAGSIVRALELFSMSTRRRRCGSLCGSHDCIQQAAARQTARAVSCRRPPIPAYACTPCPFPIRQSCHRPSFGLQFQSNSLMTPASMPSLRSKDLFSPCTRGVDICSFDDASIWLDVPLLTCTSSSLRSQGIATPLLGTSPTSHAPLKTN